jgi:transposase
VKNLGDALERLLLRHHKALQTATTISPPPCLPLPETISPCPAPCQVRDKTRRRERRLSRFEEIKRLLAEGHSQREVSRRTGQSRNTIRKLASSDTLPDIAARPKRYSKLTPFTAILRQRWQDRCFNATELHREICIQGFTGNVSAVQRFVQSWREKPGRRINGRHPPPLPLTPRQCSWLLTNPDHPRVTDEQRECLRRLTEASPILAAAQNLAQSFCHLVRNRGGPEGLAGWLERVFESEITELKGFARGLLQDRAAIEAALSLEWSNGQVEGQINRLKFLKRSMYGRGGFDLLKARVLHRTQTIV